MKPHQGVRKRATILPQIAWLVLVGVALGRVSLQPSQAATKPMVWDTGSRYTDTASTLDTTDRRSWKAVPSELFAFEADPPKAASDPGYYGREHSFKGDTVVENQHFTAVFWSAKGRVVLYAKTDAQPTDAQPTDAQPTDGAAAGAGRPGRKLLEFVPLPTLATTAMIRRCEVVWNAGDEAVLRAHFSLPGTDDVSVRFTFGRNEILEIQPSAAVKGMRLLGSIDYGIVPGFVGDDLIFGAAEHPSVTALAIPAEQVFVGLLKGEHHEFVMTWPPGRQQLNLRLTGDSPGGRAVESVDFMNDGKAVYLAALSAPGLWHRDELKPAYLEKVVPLAWKRPFAARWKTQLSEAGIRTTFAFRESPGQIWRGVPGSYNYPVWFEGDNAFYHFSKKVPPKGEALIYFLEGQDTPLSVSTPVDVMKATLGRPMCEALLDVAGRKLRTHHRRGGDGVHRACTCGFTEAIQGIFEAGQEVSRRHEIQESLVDMNYFVERHGERIEEYQRFASELLSFMRAKAVELPELKPYLEDLGSMAQQIPDEYQAQKENMKTPEHAKELTRQTLALTAGKSPGNLPAFMELLKAWRAMGGAQDYVVAQCHRIVRKLSQDAGYGSVQDARAVIVAQEIRARCRQVLRHPDGYEIWADY